MDLNLRPYSVTITKPDYYWFVTDEGDEYECIFLS